MTAGMPSARRRGLGSPFAQVPRQVLMVMVAIISLQPIAFVLMTSLKSGDEYVVNRAGLPQHPSLANYVHALTEMPTLRWAMHSVFVTVCSVVVSAIIAALAAYAITFSTIRGRTALLTTCIALIMVPPVVLVLPMFVTMVNLGLVNTLTSLVVFYVCLLVPFSVFFMSNFFAALPSEIVESAAVDGASPLRTLWHVVLPVSRPALVTLAVVNAIWAWNELLVALVFVQDENMRTLMAGLSLLQGRYSTNQPLVLTVAVLSILPVALFYVLSQRTFVRGLTAGVGK